MKGPPERRWDAAYNQARRTGDLFALEMLDELRDGSDRFGRRGFLGGACLCSASMSWVICL
jgi:hypothetical protein